MRMNKFLVILSVLILFLMTYVSAATFEFNGTVLDTNGNAVNGAIINITVRSQSGWSIVGYNTTTTNSTGWFNLSVECGSNCLTNGWMYAPSITHNTSNYIDYVSKTLPALPSMPMQFLAGATFYLSAAGTMNLTAVNSSGQRISFNYQIKDTKLGYPIAESFDRNNMVSEAIVYLPRDRNYSVMIYPSQSMPVSYNWNNFTATSSYTFANGISSYNFTTKTLQKQFNITMSMPRVTGYINYTGINGWASFGIVPFLVEPGNMVHASYGPMPYNLSAMSGGTDFINLTSGFYNITLPATVETSTVLLLATAKNGTLWYGGFNNLSLDYATYPTGTEFTGLNFTYMVGLVGSESNISLQTMSGATSQFNISTAKKTFNLINSTAGILGGVQGHIEATLDYTALGVMEFTWMIDSAQSATSASFSVPLLNNTGVKEINAFVSGGPSGSRDQYSPKRTSFTAAELQTLDNITITTFNPGGVHGNVGVASVNVALYLSNSTCDIPNPSSACNIGSSASMTDFNPIKAIMGGGKISFRMGTGNISVHYINVDLMASGPPDALFENNLTNSGSGSFSGAMKFGSGGPTIYDYVLVSMPYVEGVGGLNEALPINMSIPKFYDDSWNVIWDTALNGTAATSLAGNNSHYSTYSSDWNTLMSSKTCTTGTISSAANINASNPCYVDTTNNRLWIRLPHFSGSAPTVTGSVVAAAATTTTTSTSSSGGSGASAVSNVAVNANANTLTTLNVKNKAIGVETVNLITNTKVENGLLQVLEVKSLPSAIATPITGEVKGVYKYFEVKKFNLLDSQISTAKISFSVKMSWLNEQKKEPKDVVLLRYTNDKWTEHATVKTTQDSEYYYFDSNVPGFSTFAISVKEQATVVPQTTMPEQTGLTSEIQTITEPENKSNLMVYVGILVVIILAVLGYWLWNRRKMSHKPRY